MEEVIKIHGGKELNGEVIISGSKNATVALIPAAILANGPVTIFGVPKIADVNALSEILNILNVDVREERDHLNRMKEGDRECLKKVTKIKEYIYYVWQ